MSIIATAPGICGRATPAAGDRNRAVRISDAGAIVDAAVDRVVCEFGCAGDAFTLRAEGVETRKAAIVGRQYAGRSTQTASLSSAETAAGDVDAETAEIEDAGDVDRDHSAGRSVPRRRNDIAGQSCIRVLRHANDLVTRLTMRCRRSRESIAIDEAIAASGAGDRHGASADHPGGDDVLIQTCRPAGRAGRRIAGITVAVRAGVRNVDGRILHLDDQQKIASGDERGRSQWSADGYRRISGGGAGCR